LSLFFSVYIPFSFLFFCILFFLFFLTFFIYLFSLCFQQDRACTVGWILWWGAHRSPPHLDFGVFTAPKQSVWCQCAL
jgi:hypothetical protein